MTVTTELYDKLGVPPNATKEDIKKAYRKKAKQFHPDSNPGTEEEFKAVSLAYSILSNPSSRRRYDESGSEETVTTHIKQEAMTVVMMSVSEKLNQGDGIFYRDVFKEIEKDIRAKGIAELKTIKAIKGQAKKVEKFLSKVIHKNKEQSFIVQSLTAEKNNMLMTIAKNKVRIKILRTARFIVKEYQFQKEQQSEQASSPYAEYTKLTRSNFKIFNL